MIPLLYTPIKRVTPLSAVLCGFNLRSAAPPHHLGSGDLSRLPRVRFDDKGRAFIPKVAA